MENMYQTIYEAVPDLSVAPPLVIVCVLTLCLVTYIIYAWKTGKDDYIFLIFVAVFLVFIISCSFYTSIDAKQKVYDEYAKGNYLVITGEITHYTLAEEGQPRLSDSFYVDDVFFIVPGFVSPWGYPLNRVNGGILEDGMEVIIYYIPYKFENVIMKIQFIDN